MTKHVAPQNKDSTNPWDLLYHYTTQDGLFGILESSSIWATDYRFLNDLSERNEALALFSDHNSRQAAPGSDHLESELRSVDAYYVSFTQEEHNPDLPSNAQLSGDRLSQWRGYSQGRQGFSLGFNSDRLLREAEELKKKTSAEMSIDLWCCYYKNDFKDGIVEVYKGHSANDPKKLHEYMARFKHIGFEEEKERRLVLQSPAGETDLDLIQFRNGAFGRTPYIKVPLGLKGQHSPLERIVVGPSQHMDQTAQSLRLELRKMGLQGVKVAASEIPYRN